MFPNATGGTDALRARYLEVARGLLSSEHEQLHPYVVSHLGVVDLAVSLGLHRTTMYRLWPSQAAMWRDLLEYVLVSTPPLRLPATDGDASTAFDELQAALQRSSLSVLRTTLLAFHPSEAVQPALTVHMASTLGALAADIDDMLRRQGLAVSEPWSAWDVALFVLTVGDGLGQSARLLDWLDRRDVVVDGSSRGLLAHASTSLLGRITRPRRPSDPVVPPRIDVPDMARWDPRQRDVLDGAAAVLQQRVAEPTLADGRSSPVGYLTLARVARAAGVTRQAVQRCFRDQSELAEDLMRYLYAERRSRLVDSVRRGWRAAHVATPPSARAAADTTLAHLLGAASPRIDAHLAFGPHLAARPFTDVARTELAGALDTLQHDLGAVLSSLGLTTRDGVGTHHLAALFALATESAVRVRRFGTDVRPGRSRPGSLALLSIGLEAVAEDSLRRVG